MPLISNFTQSRSPSPSFGTIAGSYPDKLKVDWLKSPEPKVHSNSLSDSGNYLRAWDTESHYYSMWSLASVMGSAPMVYDVESEEDDEKRVTGRWETEKGYQRYQMIGDAKYEERQQKRGQLSISKILKHFHLLELFR